MNNVAFKRNKLLQCQISNPGSKNLIRNFDEITVVVFSNVRTPKFTYWPPCGIHFGEFTGRPTRKELSAEGEVDELGCSGAEGLVGNSRIWGYHHRRTSGSLIILTRPIRMTMGENKDELHGGESSWHASPPLWSELERGSSQARLKNGNWIVLNPMAPLVLNYWSGTLMGSYSLSEDCITDLYDFILWYHFDFCSLCSNNFNSASNSRWQAFRATISVRLLHAL